MPTATKAQPTPIRTADVRRLTLRIRGVDYHVRGIRADAFGATARAYRLRKAGSVEPIHAAETVHGPTCDCPDQTFRHGGLDAIGCKHIRAMRALGLVR